MAKSKPKPEIVELEADIDKFISRLSRNNINGGIITRLNEVKDNLGNQASEWYHMDIYTVLNPGLLLEQFRNVHRKRAWWLGYIELFRNFLVLLPILFTWFALSRASEAYYQAINNNGALADIPFLVQWESGFNGILPIWLHFSQVAILDAMILVLIVIATLFVHFESNILFEHAEKKALQLTSDFDDLLLRIYKVFVQQTDPNTLSQTLLNSINDYSESFQKQGESFQDLLTAEQERLEKLNDSRFQELKEFDKVSTDLKETASQLTKFTNETKQTFDDLQKLLSSMAGQIQAIPKSQDSLDRTLKSLEGHLGGFEVVIKNLVHKLDKGFADMTHSVHQELTSLENAVRQVSNNQNELVQIVTDERKNTNNSIKNIEVIVARLEETAQNYETYSQKFIDTYEDSVKELNTLSINIEQFTSTIKSSPTSPINTETELKTLINELHTLNTALRKNRLLNFLGNKQK